MAIGDRSFVNPFDDRPKPRMMSQAERIIRKFGGPRDLWRSLQVLDPSKHRNPTSIYRWQYSKAVGGTGGLIPTAALGDIIEAARANGIFLDVDDLDPRPKMVKP